MVFVLTAFIPLMILEFVNTFNNYKYNKNMIMDNSRTFVQQVSNNVQDRLYSLEMSSMTVIIDRNLRKMLESDLVGDQTVTSIDKALEANQFMATLEIQNNHIWAVTLITTTDIYCRFNDQTAYDVFFRSKYKQMDWYKASVQNAGTVYVEGVHYPYQAVSSDQKVISVSRSIFDSNTNEYWGTILIDVKVDLFENICAENPNNEDNFIEILDQKNEVVYASPNAILQDKNSLEAFFKNNIDTELMTLSDGNSYMAIYTTIPETNWKIVRFVSSKYMLQDSFTSIRIGIILSFITLFFILIGSIWLIRTILIPINQLNVEAQKIGTGDFSSSDESGDLYTNEIGQLYRSIARMKHNLNELITRLSDVMSRQKEVELNALQKQIKPHFIYNTLNSIQMLAIMEGAKKSAEMIRDFGMLFRSSIEKGDLIVPLWEELDNVRRYMNIQKLRYGDKIKYYDEIDPAIQDYCIIRLTLQPTVENAVSHGLENKIGNGYLRIRSQEDESSIKIIVEDNGIGISKNEIEQIKSHLNQDDNNGRHIGLVNVHKRLQNYFGNQYGIEIKSQEGIGTIVELNIPKIKLDNDKTT